MKYKNYCKIWNNLLYKLTEYLMINKFNWLKIVWLRE